jgi:hypothetical protein
MAKTKINTKRIFPKEGNYFFGYYGISPWNKKEDKILGLKVPFINKQPSLNTAAEIVLKNLKTNKTTKIAETKTWCWQQGCMLQWLGPNLDSKIIYNNQENNKFVSVIQDIRSRKKTIINFPIYAVCSSGEKALSLNFARLNDMRKGYGYFGNKDKNEKKKAPKNDGIYLVDLKTNKKNLIISLERLSRTNSLPSMKKGKHWVDHIEVGPNGKRFCFFHRWEIGGGLFHTRLFSANLSGEDLFMFPDGGFYSHITWKNNRELFGYASLSEGFGNIRNKTTQKKSLQYKLLRVYKKFIPKFIKKRVIPVSYWILKDQKPKREHIKLKIENEDGHGTWNQKETHIITDTYPDKKNFRKLLLYDLRRKKKITVGKFYSIPKIISKNNKWGNSPARCDLHPRWSPAGDRICIDSVHEGKRNMYEIKFSAKI